MENQENGETLNHFLKAKILKLFFPLAKNTKYTVMYEQNTPTELFKEKKKKIIMFSLVEKYQLSAAEKGTKLG